MNALGWLMLGSMAHATGFAVIGSIVYLALRRSSPAAGALAAASSLVIMALVSLIVLGPGRAGGVVSGAEQARHAAAVVSRHRAEVRSSTRPPMEPDGLGVGTRRARPNGSCSRRVHEDGTEAMSAWIGDFLSELRRTAGRPRAAAHGAGRNGSHSGSSRAWAWAWLGLGLGIWSIQRLRARSRPIEEPDLCDIVEILRAELSCRETSRFAKRPNWRRRPRSAGGGRSCSCRATGAIGTKRSAAPCSRMSWHTSVVAIS